MERSLRYLLFSENRFETSFFNDLENQLRQISRKSFVICAKPILNCFWFILEGKEKINVIVRRFWNFWKNNGTHQEMEDFFTNSSKELMCPEFLVDPIQFKQNVNIVREKQFWEQKDKKPEEFKVMRQQCFIQRQLQKYPMSL